MKDKIIKVLGNINEDIKKVGLEDNLLELELLDSFEIIEVVSELEDAFDIEIDGEEIIEKNFITISAIINLIQMKVG